MAVNMNVSPDYIEMEMVITGYVELGMVITKPLVLDMTSNVVQVTGDPWEGPYEIVPHSYDQEFETNDKLFVDDLTVLSIVTHEAPNTKGTTFTIDG